MNATEAGLLHAIRAAPDDDFPRLVFADWLEDQGKADHAEFIRAQIEYARINSLHPEDNRELLILNKLPSFLCFGREKMDDYAWNGTGRTVVEYESGSSAVFCRGFMVEVKCPPQTWMDSGPGIVVANPVERVWLIGKDPGEDFGENFDRPVSVLWWYPVAERTRAHDVHTELAPFLDQKKRRLTHFFYDSRGEAFDDLSRACIAWAESKIPNHLRVKK
jgi:uncharacterized protein (TIGR02996 family)